MSIATAIQNAQEKVANSYTAVSTKGGTIPATQNLSNLPAAILSIPQGGSGTLKTWYNWSNMDNAQILDNPLSSSGWRHVEYTGGLFFILPKYGNTSFYTSSNGETWQQKSLVDFNVGTHSVTYGNSLYIMTSDHNHCLYSSDTITWTDVDVQPTSQWGYDISWNDIAFGGGKFVAVSSSAFAITDDGQNWLYKITEITPGPADIPVASWKAIEYGAGKFVTIASNSNYFAYSSNGTSWTLGTLPSSLDWRDIKYANGRFIVVASGTNKYAYSDDGVHWTEGTMPDSNKWQSITYGQGRFLVCTGTESYEFAFSYDGIHWNTGTLNHTLTGSDNFVAYGGNTFIICGGQAGYLTSMSFSSLAPCYTLEENPTTSSVVYSEPNNPSAYTITSVGTGTITLSNGYTYTYNIGGNLFTY